MRFLGDAILNPFRTLPQTTLNAHTVSIDLGCYDAERKGKT